MKNYLTIEEAKLAADDLLRQPCGFCSASVRLAATRSGGISDARVRYHDGGDIVTCFDHRTSEDELPKLGSVKLHLDLDAIQKELNAVWARVATVTA